MVTIPRPHVSRPHALPHTTLGSYRVASGAAVIMSPAVLGRDPDQFENPDEFEPDRWLVDGDTVTVGELTLEVIHCPGHTPGHVVFFNRPSKFAIVGDVLFQGSIGRTDFPMGNHQDLIDAITQKLWPLGNDVTFIPGHGPTSTFGQERQTNAFVSDYALS